jgi:hypothetical protein
MVYPKLVLSAFLMAALGALAGCAKKNVPTAADRYEKNLSKVRPHYTYVEPVIEKSQEPVKKTPVLYRPTRQDEPLYVTKRLEAVLDTMAEQNKAIRYISGFRVQLYVGNLRQEADAAKAYVYQLFPELNPYVSYSQPTYRVKAGDFMYRTDAEEYLAQIRQQYPAAVILPERVEIKKGLVIRASTGTPKY